MLSKPHRLPASEIPFVMKTGRRVLGKGITFIYTPGAGRFCFFVSTKVDKRATVRNRVRRLMSESVRHQLDSIPPIDAVIIGSKSLIGRTQIQVEAVVHDLLRQAVFFAKHE